MLVKCAVAIGPLVEQAAQHVSASPLIACTEAIDGLVQQDRGGKPVKCYPVRLMRPRPSYTPLVLPESPRPPCTALEIICYSAHGANAAIPLQSRRPVVAISAIVPCRRAGNRGTVPDCGGDHRRAALLEEAVGVQLRAFRCTHASLVATQLLRLLREDERAAPPSLKAVVVGGSSVPQNVVQEAYGRDFPVCTTYGLTEMTSQVTTLFPGASPALLATAGKVLPQREVRIAPDGEIHVRGPVLFQGYVNGGASCTAHWTKMGGLLQET